MKMFLLLTNVIEVIVLPECYCLKSLQSPYSLVAEMRLKYDISCSALQLYMLVVYLNFQVASNLVISTQICGRTRKHKGMHLQKLPGHRRGRYELSPEQEQA